MSLGKKLFFYFILLAGFPIVFLVVTEATLAILDVANPYKAEDPYAGFKNYVNVFIEDPANPDKLVINPRRARWRIRKDKIGKAIHVQWMDKNKTENGYRVMLFGGSNTFNFQTELSILRDKLQNKYPDRKVEVINLGGNAYGTHRIVKLFNEIVNYDPDLLIVYAGHNEFVEKRFYEHILNEAPWLTNLKGLLGKLRLYTLMRRVVRDIKSSSSGFFTKADEEENRKGRLILTNDVLLDITPYNKTRFRDEVMRQYETNLQKMAQIAKERGIKLIITSVASRDMTTPYAPCYNPDLGERGNRELRDLMNKVARILTRKEFREILSFEEQYPRVKHFLEKAKPIIDKASRIWAEDGDVVYWSGYIKYFEGDYEEAKKLMLESTKNDCSPRRSTPLTNAIVARVVGEFNLDTIDVVGVMEKHSPRGISFGMASRAPDESWGLYFDHCHLNNVGRSLVMELFASTIINKQWVEDG